MNGFEAKVFLKKKRILSKFLNVGWVGTKWKPTVPLKNVKPWSPNL